MGRTEEEHAIGIILTHLKSLKKDEKLKVMFDVDDTSAATSQAVLGRMGIEPSSRGKKFYHNEILGSDAKLGRYISAYHRVWQENPTGIKALLGYDSAKNLSENTDFSFISAREETTKSGLSEWVNYNYKGLRIPVILVNPIPYDMHGFHKLQQDVHVLVDDSPPVAGSMVNGYAKDRVLLLLDRWEEAVAKRNPANTAIVPDADTAAKHIIKALEINAQEVLKTSNTSPGE